jgi:hypothetical protein
MRLGCGASATSGVCGSRGHQGYSAKSLIHMVPGRATKTQHWCDLSANLTNHTPKCTPGLPLLEGVERAARIQRSTNLASKNARTGRAWLSRIIEGHGTIGSSAPSMDRP